MIWLARLLITVAWAFSVHTVLPLWAYAIAMSAFVGGGAPGLIGGVLFLASIIAALAGIWIPCIEVLAVSAIFTLPLLILIVLTAVVAQTTIVAAFLLPLWIAFLMLAWISMTPGGIKTLRIRPASSSPTSHRLDPY